MKEKIIKIVNINDLKEFVKKANDIEGDVIIQKGKFFVDGKSLLGLLSINISDHCRIYYPKDNIEFENFISSFECK